MKDWPGMNKSYQVVVTPKGTEIVLSHPALNKVGGHLTIKYWAYPRLKGKVRKFLPDLQSNELVAVSKETKIPLRILARLQRRERESYARSYRIKFEGSDIVFTFAVESFPEVSALACIPKTAFFPNGKPKPFGRYSDKDLESIHQEIKMPLWLLKMLRGRERERKTRERKARKLIKKME